MAAKSQKIIPLPFHYYYITVFFIAIGGVADSIYLAISHYKVYTDIGYSSFCAVSKAINCDTVSQSPYSIFLNMPLSIWGILGYLSFTILLWMAWRRRNDHKDGWALLQVIAILFCLHSAILAYISTYYIHSYCIMCILSYAINLMLLFYTWMIRRRFGLPPLNVGIRRDLKIVYKDRLTRWVITGICVISVFGALSFPPYWHYKADLQTGNIATGMTADGHPWIGAKNPNLVIVEYTDYLCFQCRKMHYFLRQLVSQNPDRIRLVHRNFPMDNKVNAIVKEPFHEGAGNLALLALYAAEKGRFWEMNDILFATVAVQSEHLNLMKLAKETGLNIDGLRDAVTNRSDLQYALAIDIWGGIKLHITGTPSYVINGKVYLAQIPADIINAIR